jgi:hypothetical protein
MSELTDRDKRLERFEAGVRDAQHALDHENYGKAIATCLVTLVGADVESARKSYDKERAREKAFADAILKEINRNLLDSHLDDRLRMLAQWIEEGYDRAWDPQAPGGRDAAQWGQGPCPSD